MLCDRFQVWSCRSCNRNCHFTADILRACAPLSLHVRDELSAEIFKAYHQGGICKADLFGRSSGGNSEHSH